MTPTPTSTPTFRDGIEAAARVAEQKQKEEMRSPGIYGHADEWYTVEVPRWNDGAEIAKAIRAIPTPDTLPTENPHD